MCTIHWNFKLSAIWNNLYSSGIHNPWSVGQTQSPKPGHLSCRAPRCLKNWGQGSGGTTPHCHISGPVGSPTGWTAWPSMQSGRAWSWHLGQAGGLRPQSQCPGPGWRQHRALGPNPGAVSQSQHPGPDTGTWSMIQEGRVVWSLGAWSWYIKPVLVQSSL